MIALACAERSTQVQEVPEAPREARARSPQAAAASAGRRKGARAESRARRAEAVKEERQAEAEPEPPPEKQVDKTEQARERAGRVCCRSRSSAALRDDKAIERLDKHRSRAKSKALHRLPSVP